MAELRDKTVNYRRCIADPPSTAQPNEQFNLQVSLAEAAHVVKKPYKRPIGTGGARHQNLSHLVSKQGCLCGKLVIYEDGKKIPLIDHDEDGSTWEGLLDPVDAQGKVRKVEDHTLFFAIKENHVAVIQSRELSIKDLQDFMVWLIHSSAKLVTNWNFVLQNLPSQSAREKLKDHKIRGINIGKNAFSTIRTEIPPEDGIEKKRPKYSKTIAIDPLIMSWLKSVTQDDALLDKISSNNDPGSIYVELQIKYKSRSEKDAQEIMQAIAASIGGSEDLSPEILLSGKSTIKNNELTIIETVKVQHTNGNAIADDAMTRLAEWLTGAIKKGTVL